MQDLCWTPANNGALVLDAGPCRLTVATIGGLSRFLVHRQASDSAGRAAPLAALLVASGTRPNLPAAMAAAEAAASRIAAAEAPSAGARR